MFTDSLKVVKQTMLSQEIIFKNQVHELHRLYRVQKTLMYNFFDRNELDGYNLRRHDPLPKQTSFSSTSMVVSLHSASEELLGHQGLYKKLHPIPLDLQLPADQYISNVGSEDLTLSLSIGEKKRRGSKGTYIHEESDIISKEVIDLEDSTDGDEENVPSSNYTAPATNYRGNNLSSFEVGRLDLNEVYFDDSFTYSNDPVVANGSTANSSPGFSGVTSTVPEIPHCSSQTFGEENNNSSNKSSLLQHDNDERSILIDSKSKNEEIESSVRNSDQEQRSPNSIEAKNECLNKSEESAEIDILIETAAVSLVCISMELRSVCSKNCSTKVEQPQPQPQGSSDSFELIALNLEETSMDDYYSVSSKPDDLNGMEKKDFGFKFRRGRRLKDFQKEILPNMASLSRQEISEDINILESVLRSREYRKMRGKLGDGQKFCAPARSKRSRLSNVRRRILL